MAFVLADRVRETTSSTGTGAVTLAGAASGFQSFAAIGNGNSTYYAISDPVSGAWEVGIGTYTASGTTLSRDTVLSSSNSGNILTLGAGVKDVFVTQPASRVEVMFENDVAINQNYTITTGRNGVSAGPVTVASGVTVTVPTGSTWTVV